jgi:hypothetical protein
MFKSLIFCWESKFIKEKNIFWETIIFRDGGNALTKNLLKIILIIFLKNFNY